MRHAENIGAEEGEVMKNHMEQVKQKALQLQEWSCLVTISRRNVTHRVQALSLGHLPLLAILLSQLQMPPPDMGIPFYKSSEDVDENWDSLQMWLPLGMADLICILFNPLKGICLLPIHGSLGLDTFLQLAYLLALDPFSVSRPWAFKDQLFYNGIGIFVSIYSLCDR